MEDIDDDNNSKYMSQFLGLCNKITLGYIFSMHMNYSILNICGFIVSDASSDKLFNNIKNQNLDNLTRLSLERLNLTILQLENLNKSISEFFFSQPYLFFSERK